MDLGITGRVAIVSGGSRGIGLAIARRLLEEGVKVMIAARSTASLDAAVQALTPIAPDHLRAISADMTDEAGIHAAADAARCAFGPIGIAVSNVVGHVIARDEAGPHAGHFEQVDPADYRVEFRQLALSAWHLAQAVIPDMRAQRWGRILNIGSMVAREPMWEIPHILPNTVRPAVAGLYRGLARELAADGITVNSLLTGSIATERNRDYYTWLAAERGRDLDGMLAELYASGPIRRPGDPDEMAGLALFLCSNQAGAISGQAPHVTGGRTRHLY
ncbi:MAG: SDR family oxidoreductase [Gammaproteobacteria bacterium]